ncbi:MAG: DUF2804 domain-containing protein [Actinomycetota bacterium]|nr:DUF2804 domain-containing protein [Actinomycetota bacterium]
MPMRFAGGWRKRWRYAAAFGEELMVCAARVEVGPMGQSFWAIVDRSTGELFERTRLRLPGLRGEVWSERSAGQPWDVGSGQPGVITRVQSGPVRAKLAVGPGAWAESVCPTTGSGDGAYVWTRKRVAPVDVDVSLPGGRRVRATMRGVEDESAGYHPRHTVWSWSAGVGTATDGRWVGWNLVEGVNDPPARSERAIWVEGEELVREPGPVRFVGLDAIDFDDGSRMDFVAEAERARRENKIVVRYSYRQPFGTFSGSLAGIDLGAGIGVMEHHDAVW